VASIVVVFTIAWGFKLVGSPATRRLERLDEQRLEDLLTIAREILLMVLDRNKKGVIKEGLPKDLVEASLRARNARLNPSDPETGEAYVYNVKNETTFELCAEFSLPRDDDSEVFWNHGTGRHCFTINVLDPPPGLRVYLNCD
jgi:hypothetical protein